MNDSDFIKALVEYAPLAKRTKNAKADLNYLRMGMLSEVGEVLGIAKKQFYHDKPVLPEQWADEIGDVCWYGVNIGQHFTPREFESWCRLVWGAYSLAGSGIWQLRDLVKDLVYVCWVNRQQYDDIELSAKLTGRCLGIACAVGVEVGVVLDGNVAKLRKRFPDGFVTYNERGDLHGA